MKGLQNFLQKYKKQVMPVAAAALAFVVIFGFIVHGKNARAAAATKDGISYLKKLDARETSAIEARLKEAKDAKLEAEIDQRMQELTDGTIDVWSLFDDAVLMGDSRIEEISNYEFLPKNRVLGHLGANIRKIKEDEDALVALSPSYIFLGYGLNDTEMTDWWPDAETYVKEYRQILEEMQQKLPNSKIYVNSILQAQDWTFEEYPTYASIPEWNEAIRKMCEELNIGYIDCDELTEEHEDLYEGDGIHFLPDFYKLWMAKLWSDVYGDELKMRTSAVSESDSFAEEVES